MKIESVFDASFRQYGKVVEGLHLDELLTALSKTEKPTDGVIYVPGDDSLENTPAKKELEDNVYGGMPIQIGFCNGTNTKLNCVEYHRDSEINIPCEDMILLLGKQTDITPDYHLDTAPSVPFWYLPEQRWKYMLQHCIMHLVKQRRVQASA